MRESEMHNKTIDYKEATCSNSDLALLELLLNHRGTFVSGSFLAGNLNISRPAIWKKIMKLREQGFTINAVRNRGYQLIQEPEVLHKGLICCYLKQYSVSMTVLYFPVIDSTNNEVERQYTYGRKSPFAVAASVQTNGRGRLGRKWYSASAENLYLSVLFEPTLLAERLQNFTLWVGICICRELQKNISNTLLQIKWPNDLYCDGRKFAGMLTETKMDSGSLRSIIFGVGINVNSNPNNFPKELRSSVTSLYAILGDKLPLNSLAAKIFRAIYNAYEICKSKKAAENLPDIWTPLDALAGKYVTACYDGNEVTGIARGIDTDGSLLLEQPGGKRLPIRAGAVTLKKQ